MTDICDIYLCTHVWYICVYLYTQLDREPQREGKEREKRGRESQDHLKQISYDATNAFCWQIPFRRYDRQEGEMHLEFITRKLTCTLA